MATVMTTEGPVDASTLGLVLPHEHIFLDLTREYRGDGLLNDFDAAVGELRDFAQHGGGTIIECTTRGLTPQRDRVADAARAAGVNVVVGVGFYRDPYLRPEWMDPTSVQALADELIAEVRDGIDGTNVRAGIIGEIGSDRSYISAAEERSFRAAGRAQVATGLGLTTHAARWPVGHAQLDLLAEEGVDPRNVIVGHCDTVPIPGYHLSIAERGAYVQFDTIRAGAKFDLECRVRWVRNLVDHGHENRILLSHDVCLASHLSVRGGSGYTLLMREFLPMLKAAGVSDEVVEMITVHNPRRALLAERGSEVA
jgi:predicted metal-dependent phosphotriesterase family hydrolase